MLGRISALTAAALCIGTFAMAASPSIGTVTARGETKIDNYEVKGSGTVFDGSVVETGPSAMSGADLRLANSAVVTLYVNSLGTLYHDHFELKRGTVELGSTSSFNVRAEGLVVVAETDSSGLVSIEPGNSVQVLAQRGTLEVRNASGLPVAEVHPGHALAFSADSDISSAAFAADGTVSFQNGRYYLTTSETDMKYELKGDNLQSYEGSSVLASGTLQALAPSSGVAGVILASSIQPSVSSASLALPVRSAQTSVQIGGLSVSSANSTVVIYGNCKQQVAEPCCPHTASPLCCPNYQYGANKCKSSQ